MKTVRQLERHLKGISNHWRIAILLLVHKKPNITLDEMLAELKANQKTISEHTSRLMYAGLLNKNYVGRNVVHTLSPYGKLTVELIKTLQQS